MDTIYKLTNHLMKTHGGYEWELRKWHKTSGEGQLCGPGFLHCYDNPFKAILLNPNHANFRNPRLFKGFARGVCHRDGPLKLGYSEMRLVEELPIPNISLKQKVDIAVRLSLNINGGIACRAYVDWAQEWLKGKKNKATIMHLLNSAHLEGIRQINFLCLHAAINTISPTAYTKQRATISVARVLSYADRPQPPAKSQLDILIEEMFGVVK